MMGKLIRLCIEERRVTLFITLLVALASLYAFTLLPRQESPDVSPPVALIVTTWPGASPKDINDLVTNKIDDKMAELTGYDYSRSSSHDSVSVVAVFFENNADKDKAMQDVRNAMTDVQAEFPDGISNVDVRTNLVDTSGILISLSGKNYSYEQLASFGQQFEDALYGIDGISKFSVEGELHKEVKVDVDLDRLNLLDLSMADLTQYLQMQNLEIPSGYLETEAGKVKLRAPGIFTSVKDIENLIIAGSKETGVVAKLSDVAKVSMGTEENVKKFKQNGENAVLLVGYFKEDKNVVTIGKKVRERIEEVKADLPEDLLVEEVVFQPEDVAASTNMFIRNLIEGMILVIIVVFVGMGLRNAVVVSAAIPLSIALTFGAMFAGGIKIHQMSLTALIIALGALVDDAIVISDMVQVRLNNGEPRLQAAEEGASRAALPIFTATLTTIASFLPLMFLPGAAGEFVKAIPQIVIISITASYLTAMFVTPAIAMYTFKPAAAAAEKRAGLRRFFIRCLDAGLKAKKRLLAVVFAVLVVVLAFVQPQLPKEFFPYVDKDLLLIDVDSEKSGDIEATEKLSDSVSVVLKSYPEITSVTACVGDGLPKFYLSMNPPTPSSTYSHLVAKFNLTPEGKTQRFESRAALVEHVQDALDSSIPGGKFSVQLLQNAEPANARIILRVSGEDEERLMAVVNELTAKVKDMDGVTNVRNDMAPSTYQMSLNVDDDLAGSQGITNYDVQRQVNLALYGTSASVFRKDGKAYNIRLKAEDVDVDDLENMGIKSSLTGKKVAIKQFAKVGYETKGDVVKNFNRAQALHVYADPQFSYSAAALEGVIENEVLPQVDLTGVQITFDGEREQINKYFSAAGALGVATIFVIYIILLCQFRSFMDPIIILMTVPLSMIGSMLGLWIFKQPLSFTAILGIIALIGLVVKNGILLIEYIKHAREEGLDIDEACKDAVDKRFNAIVLSSMTTVLGLFPLAISGSSLFGPMSITLMSGLAVSSFLTLVIIPVMYSMFHGFVEKVQ